MAWNPTRVSLPAATRRRILERDEHICRACGGARCGNRDLEVDHVVPVAEGGTDHDDNLQALGAWPCHREKSDEERRRGLARRDPRRAKSRHPGLIARPSPGGAATNQPSSGR